MRVDIKSSDENKDAFKISMICGILFEFFSWSTNSYCVGQRNMPCMTADESKNKSIDL